jgi:hypothetical protein
MPGQMVALKSGTALVGLFVEYAPGSHITLRLATGEVRRVEWADIQSHSLPPPVVAPAPQVVAPWPSPAPPIAPAPLSQSATVHIKTNDPAATLTRQTGHADLVGYGHKRTYFDTVTVWQNVCRAPCDQPVDRSGDYAVHGNGITPSGLFRLPPSGPVILRVRAGRSGVRLGSTLTLSLGSMGLVVGVILVGMRPLFDSPNDLLVNAPSSFAAERAALQTQSHNIAIAGGVILGTSILATVGGIAGIALSGTQVSVESHPHPATSPRE